MAQTEETGKGTDPMKRIALKDIRVDALPYMASHGEEPRGDGHWAFDVAGKTIYASGTLSKAANVAKKFAQVEGEYVIKVLG